MELLPKGTITRDPAEYMTLLDQRRVQKLRQQIAYCFENPYFRARFRDAGIQHPAEISTIEAFRSLPPLLDKASHRTSQRLSGEQHGHPFGLHLCAPLEKVIHVAGTSGTTGLPTFYLFTRKDLELTYKTMGRVFEWCGIRPGDTILQLFGLSIWLAGTTYIQAMEAYGARPIPLGAEARVSKALQYIEMCRPRAIFGTCSFISHLIERAPVELGRGAETLGVAIVVCAGEPGLAIPTVRKRLAEGFAAKVFDMSMGAWLNAAADCGGPEHNGLHYLAEDYCFRYDLVDPQTKKPLPLVDGAEGEAIHTALEYEAAPALRYASGDILKLRVGECPHCGHFGTRFSYIGRADDLLNVRGVKVYPAAIKEVVESFGAAISGHLEIVLDRPPPQVMLPVRITVEAGEKVAEHDWPALAKQIEERIHQKLMIRALVTLTAPGSIKRSNLKSRLVRIEGTD